MSYQKLKIVFIALLHLAAAADIDVDENSVYEIKSLTAEPDFRAVTLIFEIEKKRNQSRDQDDSSELDSDEIDTKGRKFNINYCEIPSWDNPHHCRTIIVKDSKSRSKRLKSIKYKTIVKNLRLATKYSFNVRLQQLDEKSARSLNNAANAPGQSIIVPTKSFAATATRCLQDESELVVETGPNFTGFITTDNGACTMAGNPEAQQSSYTLHINHKQCGSQINYDDFTVSTVVTVQENSGILTHSSKKFIVKCTFQPDTLTVRARLALPKKKGEVDVVDDDDLLYDKARNARNQKWRMVDKSSLIRKEEYDDAARFPNDLQSLPHTKIAEEEEFKPPRETAKLLKYTEDELRNDDVKFPINFLGPFTLLMTIVLVGVYFMRNAFLGRPEDD